jgi:DNA helicase-2/ATP-dependent DNA helicase PcrA
LGKPAKITLNDHSVSSERKNRTQQRDTFSKPKPASSAGTSGTSTAPRPKTTSMLPKAHIPTPGFAPDAANLFQNGMEVEHEKFGFGKIVSLEGTLPDVKATVFFQGLGNKQLLLKFAKLRIVK